MDPSMNAASPIEVNHDESESLYSDDSSESDSSNSVVPDDRRKEKARQFIACEEYRVRRARSMLCLMTVFCAVAVSVSVYASAVQYEYRTFETEFEHASTWLLTNFGIGMHENLKAMDELSAYITSHAAMTRAEFPYVTWPQFDRFSEYRQPHGTVGGFLVHLYAPIVSADERSQWEAYSAQNPWWSTATDTGNVSKFIFPEPDHATTESTTVYAPIWQSSPSQWNWINQNLLADPEVADLYSTMLATQQTVRSGISHIGENRLFDDLLNHTHPLSLNPQSILVAPVFNVQTGGANRTVVGMLLSLFSYDHLFVFSKQIAGLVCVITDPCGVNATYEIFADNVTFLGYGDLHDPMYDARFQRSAPLETHNTTNTTEGRGLCPQRVYVYPSPLYQDQFLTARPSVYTFFVIFSFCLMAVLILLYEHTVTQRYEKTLQAALRTGALIASLFPENVRDRLLEERSPDERERKVKFADERTEEAKQRPIADFFANATIMFADIAGFTAWSSTREPFQVFELLETIYGAFDQIAKRRRIFKVETVGDCYVAASGVPTPRSDHAIAMVKFARQCLEKMTALTKTLEVKLGPDTAGLAFRVGLHSGPVTGGVVRCDNARFQLFGDTVNTAARMESTGAPNRIHISQATADLLIDASKGHWVVPREELVTAKGKGQMKTYWLTLADSHRESSQSDSSHKMSLSEDEGAMLDPLEKVRFGMDERTQRLVDWNKDILLRHLKRIVARRQTMEPVDGNETAADDWSHLEFPGSVVEEVVEIISLPHHGAMNVDPDDLEDIAIHLDVEQQLYDFVASIARMYRPNSFHNFDHASHVTMSVVKLLSRIVPLPTTPSTMENDKIRALNDLTGQITSDPLTQFACIFAALIHDVDHEGVTNAQLVKEKSPIALAYKEKSVAEQQSLVLAWDLLMKPKFDGLRKTLCTTIEEARHFRQLVVNAVMATDIMAPDLKELRHRRWTTAFSSMPLSENESDTINRKATIVIEHLIQASDVCHTMQHWHVYRKWNECLFMEMSKAYAEGRAENNPADTWYKGEIGFFDFYIIPLAKKLAECGVFGVSSDEFLSYAVKNRDEWEARGEDVVHEMVERFNNM